MAKTKAATKRGPKIRTALSDEQIIAAREETLRFRNDGRVDWANPAKVVAKKAGVVVRTLQNWRDRNKTPLYLAEVVRLLFEKARADRKKPATRAAAPTLTEREVQILFEKSDLPVMLAGQPYFDWKPYWDEMQALGLVLLRNNLL